ncbi:MAG: DUF72 domain-containing protein [Thermoplasmatota archaeon]
MGRIRVGNSGWSYKDWIGPFYPSGSPMSRLLKIYLSRFDIVEINSSFYSVPKTGTVNGWIKEAGQVKGKEFSLKVPQEISHVLSMREEPNEMEQAYRTFSRSVLKPLEDAGYLGAVLFQASPYFTVRSDIKYRMKSEPKVPLPDYVLGIKRLKEICSVMSGGPGEPVIELRNSSWLNEDLRLNREAVECLREYGVALAVVDGPSFPWFHEETARHNYIRFHGRNKEGWFRNVEQDRNARYEYDYPEAELMERVDPIKIMASKVDRDTRVFFNNHPRGMAPKNASKMMEFLGISEPLGALDRFR